MTTLSNTCNACLCEDRKLILINDKRKQCFLSNIQHLQEEPYSQVKEDKALHLCWECCAYLTRFVIFIQLVKARTKKKETCIDYPHRLRIEQILNYTIPPVEITNNETIDTTESLQSIKKENCTDYSDHLSDDDRALINYVNKSDVTNGKIKKKKKRKKLKSAKIYREVRLNDEQLKEERDILLNTEEYVNAVFKCEKCIVTFPNFEDFKDHISLKHEMENGKYKCSLCERVFLKEVSYNYHMNRHRLRFECLRCDVRCWNKRDVLKHYELHCDRISYKKGNYEDYIQAQELITRTVENENGETTQTNNEADSKPSEFACDGCEKTFRWKTSLRKHQEMHRIQTGQKRKPYCEPCRLSFTNTSNLQKHVKTSSKHQIQLKLRKLQSAELDVDGAERSEAMIKQITCSVNSSREQYACSQCDKRFQWKGNLLRHLHSHAARAKGDLVCVPCNRSFSSIATYKQHMKISRKHVSEEDFQHTCKDCGQKFVSKTRLKDHIDWEHLKNYVHTCPVCQKAFKSHTSLYLHKQVVHNKDSSQHLCNHCGRSFPNHTKLRCHITALHTRECPYKCKLCSARFGWHSCLSRHLRRVHKSEYVT